MKLYNVSYSGNSYKVRLLLSQLGIPYEIVDVDILKGESRTAEFLKISPNGRTPVLDDNGFILAESNAILAYLESGRPRIESDYVFLRCHAPFRPFAHGGPVSLIVRRAFLRSGIKAPSLGSHILRHSVASEMLRQGTPLYGIATVLRHRSIDTTTIYAKVDLGLLRQVAQPWPEVLR